MESSSGNPRQQWTSVVELLPALPCISMSLLDSGQLLRTPFQLLGREMVMVDPISVAFGLKVKTNALSCSVNSKSQDEA